MSNLNNDDIRYDSDVNNHEDDSDGTLGRTAGTGAGAIAGGIIGTAVAGPVGAIVGGAIGMAIGHGGGDAAHKIGDDHDDVNPHTGSDGELGRDAGTGAGAVSGAVVGSAAGPVGTVAGAVAGGMLGAAAGDAAKDMGDGHNDVSGHTSTSGYTGAAPVSNNYQDNDTTLNAHATTGSTTDRDTIRVPVVEEEINVQKNMRQAGEVQVHKDVVTEQVNVPVEVSREEVVVTRHAVDRDLAPGETTLGDDVVRVPVMAENVEVNKTAHVVEEIEINKQRVTEQQNVTDTVRKEVVDVDDTTARVNNTNAHNNNL